MSEKNMHLKLTDLKPSDAVTAKQVLEIQEIVGYGRMHCKRLAQILNDQGFLTWENVHNPSKYQFGTSFHKKRKPTI
jgi:hypothetical protein